MLQYEREWKDYYEVLQVSPNAEPSVISAAYKRLARTYHPDVARDPGLDGKMAEINEAYEILSYPTKRQAYDRAYQARYGPRRTQPPPPSTAESLGSMTRWARRLAAEGRTMQHIAETLMRAGLPQVEANRIAVRVTHDRAEVKQTVAAGSESSVTRRRGGGRLRSGWCFLSYL